MKKNFWCRIVLIFASLLPGLALGNHFYNRATGFQVPDGPIAYMGCYFSPLRVWATGSNTTFLTPKDIRLFSNEFFVADKTRAVNETNQGLEQVAVELNLALAPVPYNEIYQDALLKHLLLPQKFLYNPKIAQYCGGRPYILIGIVDYYAEFSSSVNIRQNENGQKIDYFGRRSILEKDLDMFRTKGRQGVVALEYFLVASSDGRILWHANTVTTTTDLIFGSYFGTAKGLSGDALSDLMKR